MDKDNINSIMSASENEKIKKSLESVESSIGSSETSEKLKSALNNPDVLKKINDQMKPGDMDKIKKVLENPEALKMMLKSKQAQEQLKKILGG